MTRTRGGDDQPTAEVVCFGTVRPVLLITVDEPPAWSSRSAWNDLVEYIAYDAVLVAITLKKWAVQTGLICTALGDDGAGRDVARQLSDLGILEEFRLSPDIRTDREVIISDSTGGRTIFYKPDSRLLATLDTADLSMIAGARILYLDWYDEGHVLRALREAKRANVPVFFNFEHAHQDAKLLALYAPYITVCQAVTDLANLEQGNVPAVAATLLEAGIPTALVTMAERGCMAVTRRTSIRVHAPAVAVVDVCAAGSTFSAGYLYGLVNGWDLEERVRFGVAAASLHCTRVGPTAFPVAEIRDLGATLTVESGPGLGT